jgi:hypothetical protein
MQVCGTRHADIQLREQHDVSADPGQQRRAFGQVFASFGIPSRDPDPAAQRARHWRSHMFDRMQARK